MSLLNEPNTVVKPALDSPLPPAAFLKSPPKKTSKSPAAAVDVVKGGVAAVATPGVLKPLAFNFEGEKHAAEMLRAKKKRAEEEKQRLMMEEPLLRPNPRR